MTRLPTPGTATTLNLFLGLLTVCSCMASIATGQVGSAAAPATAAKEAEPRAAATTVEWTTQRTPADFLEAVGQVTKARWRQLYRPPPPTPSPARLRTAVTLGYLMGESYLCVQAEDTQHFRNNNQEIITYCRTLGFGEKISPMLLGQARQAEDGMWQELEAGVIEGQKLLGQHLTDQRDEDLAMLFNLGVWLRTLEIVSSLVTESEDSDIGGLCVGSPKLIVELRDNFATLPELTRENDETAKELSMLLEFLWRTWARQPEVKPSPEMVRMTHERLSQTARKVSLK